MALTQIRAEQIKDGTITNQQVSASAGITESKLALNFPTHAASDPAALVAKKVSDYVQVNDTTVASLGQIDLTAGGILANSVAYISSGDTTTEGVFDLDNANSKAIVRLRSTGEPILATAGVVATEVYGRTDFVVAVAATGTITIGGTPAEDDTVTGTVDGTDYVYTVLNGETTDDVATALAALIDADALVSAAAVGSVITITASTAGVAGNAITLAADSTGTVTATESGATLTGGADARWLLKFFYLNGVTETTYTFGGGAGNIDWQFLRRFNLNTVSELYAANEKFVYGAADANARLDLNQLVLDLFTPTYTLDHDGVANLGTPLQTMISDHIADTTDAHDASAISFVNTFASLTPVNSAVTVDTVQKAIESLSTMTGGSSAELDDLETSLGTAINADGTFDGYSGTNYIDGATSMTNADEILDGEIFDLAADLADHIGETVDAHNASAVSFDPTGTNFDPGVIDVQAALESLDTDLANHIADTVEAHMATAVGYTKAGWTGIDNVGEALDALRDKMHGHYFLEVDATAAQTEIDLGVVDTDDYDIRVELNGQGQREGVGESYELTTTGIEFTDPLELGDYIKIEWSEKTV